MKSREPTSLKSHWENVYLSRRPDELSWHVPHLEYSLTLITKIATEKSASIIDVGGGESTLVDDLLTLGYDALTVLDISDAGLALSQKRLGALAGLVRWQAADITTARLPVAIYDLWHDRAVFHFLTKEADRAAYLAQVKSSLKPGGHVVLATFSLDGPLTCSNLDVVRYDPKSLHSELGPEFTLVASDEIDHVTPSHTVQKFIDCTFRFG